MYFSSSRIRMVSALLFLVMNHSRGGRNMEHSWILILAMIGHVLCVYADSLLLCTPGGLFSFSDMKDNARRAKLFEAKPESETLQSIVLGSLAMFLQFFGYLALGIWMHQYTALWANLMIVGAAMIYIFAPIVLMVLAILFTVWFPMKKKEFEIVKKEIARREGEDCKERRPLDVF